VETLSFRVSSADNQREAVKPRVSQFVVFENGFERTAFHPVVQLHCGKTSCIKGNRSLIPRGVEKLVFRYEKELSLRVNEPSNEPGTGNAVHFDVAARDPLYAWALLRGLPVNLAFRRRSSTHRPLSE